MNLTILKFGGTSVATIERMRVCAERVAMTLQEAEGQQGVVVVSAMAGETDRLLALTRHASENPTLRESDVALATGEQLSAALFCLVLHDLGLLAQSFLAPQVKIVTDASFGRARIKRIDTAALESALRAGIVPVVAGFQGVTETGGLTTLGRGGSDLTAVALAVALKADRCDIYTDVLGVFTADPKICHDAQPLKEISYEEMLELADQGAKVLHARAVELAAKHQLPLTVLSAFEPGKGTQIVPEEQLMETTVVSGITCNLNEAKVAIRHVPDQIGVPAKIFERIAASQINVDLILQNVSSEGFTDLTFTVSKEDLKTAMQIAEGAARLVGAGRVEAAGDIAKISVVGVGMRSHAGVAATLFKTLAEEGIGIQMIGTSEIKVSVVIDLAQAETAVRALHKAFGLGKA